MTYGIPDNMGLRACSGFQEWTDNGREMMNFSEHLESSIALLDLKVECLI